MALRLLDHLLGSADLIEPYHTHAYNITRRRWRTTHRTSTLSNHISTGSTDTHDAARGALLKSKGNQQKGSREGPADAKTHEE